MLRDKTRVPMNSGARVGSYAFLNARTHIRMHTMFDAIGKEYDCVCVYSQES
jgi:hypothetical protein